MRRRIQALSLLALTVGLGPYHAAFASKSGAAPGAVSLPSGPGSVGGVGENVSPNLAMGLMSYGVKLDLPAGPGGVRPALRLSYSSGDGAGTAGFGWQIAAPSVERGTVRGLPTYTAEDLIVANGGQELVRLNGSQVAYRSRKEGDFVRWTWIDPTSKGTAGYWKAEAPDGSVSYFGADAKGNPHPDALVQGPSGVFRWHLVERVDVHGHVLRWKYFKSGAASLPGQARWMFDGAGVSGMDVALSYEARPDPMSDAKAGFLLKTRHRLKAVAVHVGGKLLRRWELGYLPDSAWAPSRLAEVRRFGTDGKTRSPLTFRFAYTTPTAPCVVSPCKPVKMAGTVGTGLVSGSADLVDMNGDGLPDIVATGSNGHRFYRNVGGTAWAAPVASKTATSGSLTLASPYARMLDHDGDGRSDFVLSLPGGGASVLYNRGTGDWQPAVTLTSPWGKSSPGKGMRLVDMDGDKRSDVLFSDHKQTWWLVAGPDGKATKEVIADAIGAGFVDDGLELADINGDGLLDAVVLAGTELKVRLNLGRGAWSGKSKSGAVWLILKGITTIPNATRHFADLNGDGRADLIWALPGKLVVHLNQRGQGFGPALSLPAPLEATKSWAIRFADMNANGTTDAVWIDPKGGVFILELYGERAHLLRRIANGRGSVTQITYGSTAAHMAGASPIWSRGLPFAMLTVDRIETWLESAPKVRHRQDFAYRDPYYDGKEKKFRGFEFATVTRSAVAGNESARSEVHFDVGAQDPYRAGLSLSREEFSNEQPIDQVVDTWGDCPVAGVKGANPAVRYICKLATKRIVKERQAPSGWVVIESTFEYDGYGNKIKTRDKGVTSWGGGECVSCTAGAAPRSGTAPCGPSCTGDERISETQFVPLAKVAGGRYLPRLACVTRMRDGAGKLLGERHTFYDGPMFVGLGACAASRGDVRRQATRIDTAKLLDEVRSAHDAHGNVVTSRDGEGFEHRMTYDGAGLHVVSEARLLDGAGTRRLVRTATWHPVLHTLLSATEWRLFDGGKALSDEVITTWAYDVIGRLTGIVHPGDSTGAASERFVYGTHAGGLSLETIRETGSTTGPLRTLSCTDGMGRSVLTGARLPSGKMQVLRAVVFDAYGKARREYQPFITDAFSCAVAVPPSVRSSLSHRDARGRVVRQELPDAALYGSASQRKTQYLPLHTVRLDEEDVAGAIKDRTPDERYTDGLGRAVADVRTPKPGVQLIHRMTYDPSGRITRVRYPTGAARTQTYDLAGRLISLTDPVYGSQSFVYDKRGRRVASTDGRGVTARTSYDALGRPIERWQQGKKSSTLTTLTYDQVTCTHPACVKVAGRRTAVHFPGGSLQEEYDLRGRPVRSALAFGEGQAWSLDTTYDRADQPITQRIGGMLDISWTWDALGRVERVNGDAVQVAYDDRGSVAEIVWQGAARATVTHDARNRLKAITARTKAGDQIALDAISRDRTGLPVAWTRALVGQPERSYSMAYDGMGRLVSYAMSTNSAVQGALKLQWNEAGLVAAKLADGVLSGVHTGTMGFDKSTAGHRLSSVDGDAVEQDAIGEVTRVGGRTVRWSYDQRLRSIEVGGARVGAHIWGPGADRFDWRTPEHHRIQVSDTIAIVDGIIEVAARLKGVRIATLRAPLTDKLSVATLGSAASGQPDALAAAVAMAQAGKTKAAARDADVGGLALTSRHALSAAVAKALTPKAQVIPILTDPFGRAAAALSAGAPLWYRDSGPFGETLRLVGVNSPPDDGLMGARPLTAGWLMIGARPYAARLAQWLAPDPLYVSVDAGGISSARDWMSPYLYALGSPLMLADPLGLKAEKSSGLMSFARSLQGTAKTIKAAADKYQGAANGLQGALSAGAAGVQAGLGDVQAGASAMSGGFFAGAGGLQQMIGGLDATMQAATGAALQATRILNTLGLVSRSTVSKVAQIHQKATVAGVLSVAMAKGGRASQDRMERSIRDGMNFGFKTIKAVGAAVDLAGAAGELNNALKKDPKAAAKTFLGQVKAVRGDVESAVSAGRPLFGSGSARARR